jgi:uncharacterized membrane protein
MSGTLSHVVIACAAFVATHFMISSSPLRAILNDRFGAAPYRGLYSLLAFATLGWMIYAYIGAPHVDVWSPPTPAKHVSLTLMMIVSVFFVCGVSSPNPTMVGGSKLVARGPVGIIKVTRHPLMWSFALWGLCHLLANGDAASMIFFATFAFVALVGTLTIDRRKKVSLGDAWPAFAAATSNLPLVAILGGRANVGLAEIGYGRLIGGVALYVVLLFAHPYVFGVDVMP